MPNDSPAVLPEARALIADMIRDHFYGAIIREEWSENGHAQSEDHDACTEVDALAAGIVTALTNTPPAPPAAAHPSTQEGADRG